MLDHLSVRTGKIVKELIQGQAVAIGGQQIAALSDFEKLTLYVVAKELSPLLSQRGSDLVSYLAKHIAQEKIPEPASELKDVTSPISTGYRLHDIRACSFRGLAPANEVWKHNFEGTTHLMYGPNGCGKSSLLGAIVWCLTGKICRDDESPSEDTMVDVYESGNTANKLTARSVALTLTDSSGDSTAADSNFWVELCLKITKDTKATGELWIKRHSETGLSMSDNGEDWKSIENLSDAGLNPLDVELHLLMPSKISQMRFGKVPDLIHLFSQIEGLDDLEEISDIAGSACASARREATKLTNGLAQTKTSISEVSSKISSSENKNIKALPHFVNVTAETRASKDIDTLTQELGELSDNLRRQIATELGLDLPEDDSEELKGLKEQLAQLPGQVELAREKLAQPIEELFPSCFDFDSKQMSLEAIEILVSELDTFETNSQKQIQERLVWAKRQDDEPKLDLLRAAAEHYDPEKNKCPVCTQDLAPVPHISKKLIDLEELKNSPHLKQTLDDLARDILSQLDRIVSANQREAGSTSIKDRLLSDWTTLKNTYFAGHLKTIAELYDSAIEMEVNGGIPDSTSEPLSSAEEDDGPVSTFKAIKDGLAGARKYIELLRSAIQHREGIISRLQAILTGDSSQKDAASLQSKLIGSRAACDDYKDAQEIIKDLATLKVSQETKNKTEKKASTYRDLADALERIKALGQFVRLEIVNSVTSVEPVMKDNYSKLYDDELLPLDMLTTGHAANPSVRTEINAYLKVGNERVPVGPFSNAGRLRAIALSFFFALLEKSTDTIHLLVLDDLALSLDDEHQARFVDHLIQPIMQHKQVLFATHYEEFYKIAIPVFKDSQCVQMPPRRTSSDAVSFEPGDLLERVSMALESGTCIWREAAGNLRRWVERSLTTLSGYCPEPFVIFNKVRGSIDAYEAITDSRVATEKRTQIIAKLRTPAFDRIVHRTNHDENPTRPEVEDGLKCLQECKRAVFLEIDRFKKLYRHKLLDRSVPVQVAVNTLSIGNAIPQLNLPIVGKAAAGEHGSIISWESGTHLDLSGCETAMVKMHTLDPIARLGQILLLDPIPLPPSDGDLVIVRTESGEKLARRHWHLGPSRHLETANPTLPHPPHYLKSGEHEIRRIVGVLFDGHKCQESTNGEEWVALQKLPKGTLDGLQGIAVDGTCLEPIARDGQTVIVGKDVDWDAIRPGDLVCVDLHNDTSFIKRVYLNDKNIILCPVNPVDIEHPILTNKDSVKCIRPLAGVLFEHRNDVSS